MTCGNQSIDVPHKEEIPCGLSVGVAVRVQLYVKEDASGFEINFNTDACGSTVALQFNASQCKQTVVLNTKDGCWKEPEKVPGCFKFLRNQYFEIVFIATGCGFDIYVNGSFYTSYKYRIAIEKVRYLEITGDIILLVADVKQPLPKDSVKLLPSSPKPGDIIAVNGFFHQSSKGFYINLVRGNCSKDIALHFYPRLEQNVVVLNSQKNGCWEQEERHPLPCQLKENRIFEVEITYTSCNVFKIFINGQWFANFTARGPVVDILEVQVREDAYFHDIQLLRKVDKPYVEVMPIKSGSWVRVTGVVLKSADRFEIYFQVGSDAMTRLDVPFVFNPRFQVGCTVRNTMFCGRWGAEERQEPGFPFRLEERFEIIFLVRLGVYKVFVNGKFYLDYAHRVEPCHVSHVLLTGDADFFKLG